MTAQRIEMPGPIALARCPKCKQALSGLIIVKGVPQTAQGGTRVGSAWCQRCERMIHLSKREAK